ncbi:hypothetical protein [Streptomyces sp. NPDC002187]|uniref:hypothetical protein n=1 Tax=Streptomyces sp. NPDC002187 TaxID=3364637 RepID=UPI0036C15C41
MRGRRIRIDAATPVRFLAMLDRAVTPCRQIRMVPVTGASHIARKTRAWPAAHPRRHVHRTPPHASWPNQVERFSAPAHRVQRSTSRH